MRASSVADVQDLVSLVRFSSIQDIGDFMKKVLVVDDWHGWQGPVPILDVTAEGAEVHVVGTVEEASVFFNGEAEAAVIVMGGVQGASEFIKSLRSRFARLHIVGLAEHRVLLSNVGCNCFVNRQTLGLTVASFLQR